MIKGICSNCGYQDYLGDFVKNVKWILGKPHVTIVFVCPQCKTEHTFTLRETGEITEEAK